MNNTKIKTNIFTCQFLCLYLKHFFIYVPIFFKTVDYFYWYLFFKSANHVAYETAKSVILIQSQPDIWSANQKKHELIKYYQNIANNKQNKENNNVLSSETE